MLPSGPGTCSISCFAREQGGERQERRRRRRRHRENREALSLRRKPTQRKRNKREGGGGWMKAILCIHLALISQKERVMVRQETEGLLFLALLGIQSDWPIFSPLLWIFPCLYPVHSHFKSQEPAFIFFRQTGRQLKVLCHHFIFYFLSPSYLYFFFAHMVCQCHVLPSVDYQALNLIPSVDTQFWLAARFQFLKMDT